MSNAIVPQTSQPAYRMIGSTMIVTSSSNPRTTYTVTDRGCTCKGAQFRGACKHQTLRADVLATRASRPRQTDAEYAAAQAAVDELF